MNKRITLLVMLVCLLGFGGQAFADLCTIDAVPAATLLLPAFQVDISPSAAGGGELKCGDGTGITTLFSVNNASAAPALVHATMWTDWSWPTLDFDIYLTGFDVQTVNLCDVFKGQLPITAHPAGDPADTISPHRGMDGSPDNPLWDDQDAVFGVGGHPGHGNPAGPLGIPPALPNVSAFSPSCNGVLPFGSPALNVGLVNRISNSHAGFVVPGITQWAAFTCGNSGNNCCTGDAQNGAGSCSATTNPLSPGCPDGTIARGYVTLDNVNECSVDFPSDPGYFQANGTGIANNNNQIWGDWFYIDDVNGFAQGDVLVHIEAHNAMTDTTMPKSTPRRYQLDPSRLGNPLFGTDPTGLVTVVPNPHGYTFYGRYVAGGVDNREPLGTSWAARYIGAFTGGTTYVAWRDSTITDSGVDFGLGYDCGVCQGSAPGTVGPDWCPLNEQQAVCWDEAEDVEELCFRFGGGVVSPPDPDVDPQCFPLEVNFTQVGVDPFDPSWLNGWCFVNLNHPTTDPALFGNVLNFGGVAQSYMFATTSALGTFSVGLPAVQFTDACQAVPFGGIEPLILHN